MSSAGLGVRSFDLTAQSVGSDLVQQVLCMIDNILNLDWLLFDLVVRKLLHLCIIEHIENNL